MSKSDTYKLIKLPRALAAIVLPLTGLIVALALSWLLLAQWNFSYGFWHDNAGIGAAIDRFAPNNRYKGGFHLTSRDQRVALFAGINAAIHRDGKGLEALTYKVPGHMEQTLLREPEIVHLQDVAHLINQAKWLVLGATAVWIGLWSFYYVKGRSPPSLKTQLLGTLGFVVLVALVVLVIGPVKVFYALHVALFPEGHQWFFYYEESLMSTMMLAPDLFGWIAVEWLTLALVFFVFLQYSAGKLVLKKAQKKKGAKLP